ncbi:hypothetical protein LR48_Vigan05g070100 [Vigna angularis]|uniref:Putative plant transposon protein domain-containing protein n=1 Tax=Phaseolus angularis TaxID=3914 RepID=A0A0L9UKK9_PHAAN|nr:hypothetical protein LR48_Vigan05g070100 [Vigna angularis]
MRALPILLCTHTRTYFSKVFYNFSLIPFEKISFPLTCCPSKFGVGREHHRLKAFSIHLASPPKALLLYCAIRNLNVNIGQVIADEIRMCANTTNSKAPLGHPSLIIHLCKITGVDTSAPPFERPRKAIDEAYYRQYCGGAQLQSIHRGHVATTEMIVGMYDTPPAHRGTMEEFHNVVAWPEEQEKSQLPLNGTQELTLDPLRGENAAEGKNQLTHLPLSGSLPLSVPRVCIFGWRRSKHILFHPLEEDLG